MANDDDYYDELEQSLAADDAGNLPASPASDQLFTTKLPPDHPITDAEIDAHELYDEGLHGASGIEDLREGNRDKNDLLYGDGEDY